MKGLLFVAVTLALLKPSLGEFWPICEPLAIYSPGMDAFFVSIWAVDSIYAEHHPVRPGSLSTKTCLALFTPTHTHKNLEDQLHTNANGLKHFKDNFWEWFWFLRNKFWETASLASSSASGKHSNSNKCNIIDNKSNLICFWSTWEKRQRILKKSG